MTPFLDQLKVVATHPYAFIAYLVLIALWATVAIKTHRLKTIAQVISALPEADRRPILENDYGFRLKEGMSSEDFLRAQRLKFAFIGTMALLAGVVLLLLIAMLREPHERSALAGDLTEFPQRSPELLFPDEGFSFDHDPRVVELKWTSVPDATSYVVDVQNWSAKESRWRPHPPQLKPHGTRAEVTLSGDELWRWRVSARDESGVASKPSEWRGFRFPDIPPPSSQREPLMLRDGEVLVIRGTSLPERAAIELTHGPDCKATYNWRFRRSSEMPEGAGSGLVFDQPVSGDRVREMRVYGDKIIEAGPFHIRWGCASEGAGYIYPSSTFEVDTVARVSLADFSL